MEEKKYFHKIYNGTKTPSLKAMEFFMSEYDNFQTDMKFIHIAGTNGKGSCAEMISNILICQGYKVGKLISPHLVRYNERITINKEEISDEDLDNFIKELEPKINKYNLKNDMKITPFEIETIMALLYFYRKKVDFVVMEVGLGGLYDSTNIITAPLISIITSVGYDHMNILGKTLIDIAYQKSGIMKKDSISICFEQSQDIDEVFKKEAEKKNNKLILIKKSQIKNYRFDNNYQYFDFENYKNIIIKMKGKKQVNNASVAIKCIEILNRSGYIISEENMRKGLKTAVNKGRMEVLNEEPLVIYDGAHNEPAIENFIEMLDIYYKDQKKVIVVSILKTKDYEKIVELLINRLKADFIFTSGNDKELYIEGKKLHDVALKYKKDQKIDIKSLDEAIKYIKKEKNNKVNFFIGSFYIYRDVKEKLRK